MESEKKIMTIPLKYIEYYNGKKDNKNNNTIRINPALKQCSYVRKKGKNKGVQCNKKTFNTYCHMHNDNAFQLFRNRYWESGQYKNSKKYKENEKLIAEMANEISKNNNNDNN
jgi:hypothetical protein